MSLEAEQLKKVCGGRWIAGVGVNDSYVPMQITDVIAGGQDEDPVFVVLAGDAVKLNRTGGYSDWMHGTKEGAEAECKRLNAPTEEDDETLDTEEAE